MKWTAADALSGIDGAAPADSTITSEGDALSTSASVSDKAGNTVSTTVKGIKIDRHAPSTDATAPSGWQSSDVTVKLSATDNLSGVAATYYTVDGGAQQAGTTVSVTSEGTHKVAYWSVDKAGNTETAGTVTVLVDKTAPTITGKATTSPNAAGWYNAPVTVQFDCKDAVSGIASCQPDATLAAQGANSATGTAVDNAGGSDQPAPRFQHDADIEIVQRAADRAGEGGGRRGRLVTIRNAEAAAAVHDRDRQASARSVRTRSASRSNARAVRGERQDLTADMCRQPDRLDARQVGGAAIQPGGIGVGDAELVPRAAGADLGMGAGIDIGVDAQRDPRGAAMATASAESTSNSSALSTLICAMSSESASRSSRSVLPTPENTMRSAGTPAARRASSSPSLTTSTPAPSAANRRSTASRSFAFMA